MALLETEFNNSLNNENRDKLIARPKSIRIKKVNFFLIPGLTLFFLMLFVPTTYQSIKAVLLAVTITIILVKVLKTKETNLAPQIFFWVFIWVCSGVFFMLIGSFNGNPGALRVGTVYALWPLIYMLFIMGSSRLDILIKIFKVLVIASLVIGVHALSYILYSYGWLPSSLYLDLDMRQSIGFYSGMMAYSMHNTATLIFLLPFLISILMIWPRELKVVYNKAFVYLGLIIGIILTFLSGRRILQILVVTSPFIVLFFQRHLPKVNKRKVKRITMRMSFILLFLGIFIYFLINQIYEISIVTVIEDIKQGFQFSTDSSALLRSEQFFALLNGWSQNPLLGAGHGASAPGSIRSVEQPWAYELSYVAYFFHTGILGSFLFFGQLGWIYFMSFKIIKSESVLKFYIFPVIVGTTCFLIANATNPYLAKYDFMWVLFLPLAIINIWLINRRKL